MSEWQILWKFVIGAISIGLMYYATIKYYKFQINNMEQKLQSYENDKQDLKGEKRP